MFYLSIGCLTSVRPETRSSRGHLVLRNYAAVFPRPVQFILLDVSSETRDLLGYFSAIEHMGHSRVRD